MNKTINKGEGGNPLRELKNQYTATQKDQRTTRKPATAFTQRLPWAFLAQLSQGMDIQCCTIAHSKDNR